MVRHRCAQGLSGTSPATSFARGGVIAYLDAFLVRDGVGNEFADYAVVFVAFVRAEPDRKGAFELLEQASLSGGGCSAHGSSKQAASANYF